MKQLSILTVMLALVGCSNPMTPQVTEAPVNYLYKYDWHNPIPFSEDSAGGDGHWFNTVRNSVLNASKWEANEGFVSIEPFSQQGSYSILMLILPFDSVSMPTFSFTVTKQTNGTGIMKVNALADTGFTAPLVIDLATLQNGKIEYTLPSSWETVNIQIFADAQGSTPKLEVSNTSIY